MAQTNNTRTIALGLLGAVIGGLVGYFAFIWIASQGFYALVIPPAFVGLGAGLAARERSVPLAAVCAAAGLALGLFAEWRLAPFRADTSLSYFITHVHELRPVTLILLGIGALMSYRLALGFDRRPSAT